MKLYSDSKKLCSQLQNLLLMIHIYKDQLDGIETKLIRNELIKVKESRIAATFIMYQF